MVVLVGQAFYNGAQFIGTFMTSTLSRVQAGSFLTLHYRLAGPAGDIINTFGAKPATLSLGMGELAPVLEETLLGLEEGVHTTLELPAGAYGERNPAMQQWLSRKELRELGDPAEQYQVGDVVQFPTPDRKARFGGVVLQLGEESVLFDFNHPLAGQPVTFEVQLIGVL
jgi:FKBP-type peptidyl-prolyl cis-trans isomerase SlpA